MLQLAIAILSVLPHDDAATDSVDVIELSHFYDNEGRLVFDQSIFWRYERDGTNHVRAWRLWKQPTQTPWRDWRRGGFVTAWFDGDVLRVVRASGYRETWEQADRELDDRPEFAKEERSGLRGEHQPPMLSQPLTP